VPNYNDLSLLKKISEHHQRGGLDNPLHNNSRGKNNGHVPAKHVNSISNLIDMVAKVKHQRGGGPNHHENHRHHSMNSHAAHGGGNQHFSRPDAMHSLRDF
jgi:hypothetical protein